MATIFDYYSEHDRLKSFENYQCSDKDFKFDDDLKHKFALAGLYWTKLSQKIQCVFCHFQLIELKAGDTDPVELHFRFQSTCPLYTNSKTSNDPKPIRIQYQSFDTRIKTFDYLINSHALDNSLAEKLCRAGYYSIPGTTQLTCFCCNVGADISEELWQIINKHEEKKIYCRFHLELDTKQLEVERPNHSGSPAKALNKSETLFQFQEKEDSNLNALTPNNVHDDSLIYQKRVTDGTELPEISTYMKYKGKLPTETDTENQQPNQIRTAISEQNILNTVATSQNTWRQFEKNPQRKSAASLRNVSVDFQHAARPLTHSVSLRQLDKLLLDAPVRITDEIQTTENAKPRKFLSQKAQDYLYLRKQQNTSLESSIVTDTRKKSASVSKSQSARNYVKTQKSLISSHFEHFDKIMDLSKFSSTQIINQPIVERTSNGKQTVKKRPELLDKIPENTCHIELSTSLETGMKSILKKLDSKTKLPAVKRSLSFNIGATEKVLDPYARASISSPKLLRSTNRGTANTNRTNIPTPSSNKQKDDPHTSRGKSNWMKPIIKNIGSNASAPGVRQTFNIGATKNVPPSVQDRESRKGKILEK